MAEKEWPHGADPAETLTASDEIGVYQPAAGAPSKNRRAALSTLRAFFQTFTSTLFLPFGINGDLTGNSTGTHTGDVIGNVTGNLDGDSTGTHVGPVNGNTNGTHTGPVVGNADTSTLAANSSQLGGVNASNYARTDITETFAEKVDFSKGAILWEHIAESEEGAITNPTMQSRLLPFFPVNGETRIASGAYNEGSNASGRISKIKRNDPNFDVILHGSSISSGWEKNQKITISIDSDAGTAQFWDIELGPFIR